LSCDPAVSDCKALDQFSDSGVDPETDDGTLFGKFDTGVEKQDRLLLVVADRGAQLVTSDVITASASSRPSGYSSDELRFNRATQQLAWPRLPDNDLYIVSLVDEKTDRPLTAITTRRKSWTYPELQGIVQYLHDPAEIPDLRPGGRYLAVLYSVNRQRWATFVTNAVVRP
jgi:hypothetical protein